MDPNKQPILFYLMGIAVIILSLLLIMSGFLRSSSAESDAEKRCIIFGQMFAGEAAEEFYELKEEVRQSLMHVQDAAVDSAFGAIEGRYGWVTLRNGFMESGNTTDSSETAVDFAAKKLFLKVRIDKDSIFIALVDWQNFVFSVYKYASSPLKQMYNGGNYSIGILKDNFPVYSGIDSLTSSIAYCSIPMQFDDRYEVIVYSKDPKMPCWQMIEFWAGILLFLSAAISFILYSRLETAKHEQLKDAGSWKHYMRLSSAAMQRRIEYMLRFVECLSVYISDKPDSRQIYHNLGKETDRLGLKILELKNYALNDDSDLRLQFEKINPLNLITSVIEVFEPQIEEADAIIRLDVASDIDDLKIDKKAMMIAMTLLLENAILYSSHKREIAVSARQDGTLIHLIFSDNGFGIPPEECSKVTGKFYRYIDEQRENIFGSGIGLYLVKRIVEAHYGTLKIGSTENQGTTVIITLSA